MARLSGTAVSIAAPVGTRLVDREADDLHDRINTVEIPLNQLDEAELQIAPLLELQGEHRIPEDLWSRVRAHFAA